MLFFQVWAKGNGTGCPIHIMSIMSNNHKNMNGVASTWNLNLSSLNRGGRWRKKDPEDGHEHKYEKVWPRREKIIMMRNESTSDFVVSAHDDDCISGNVVDLQLVDMKSSIIVFELRLLRSFDCEKWLARGCFFATTSVITLIINNVRSYNQSKTIFTYSTRVSVQY